MNLRKSIAKVFSANILQLISSLIIGFIVPIILSIEGYANLKTYALYVSYIGFFHFGFIDGLYIKYGGKKVDEIDKGILKGEHNFLVMLELIISLVLFICSLVANNIVLFLFSVSILPIMIHSFHKYFNQAIGNFDKYSKIMYTYVLIYTLLNIVLAVFLKNSNYILYCLTTFGANLISILMVEIKFLKEYKNEKAIITKDIFNNIKVGFFILLGNLSVIALFGIDKWFVKLFLSIEDFAYYSFAVSMLNIINILVNAISITFYNYLFQNNNHEKINKLKKYLLTLGGISSAGYFVLAFIVNNFITKYIPSLKIISITFSIFPYMILINALYVNLYKVNKDEKKYFKVVVSMLVISIMYNLIAVLLFKNTVAIAYATIITLITWVIYSTKDLKNVESDKKMYGYLLFITISFFICAQFKNVILGAIIYVMCLTGLTFVFNKGVIEDFFKEIKKYIVIIKNKKNSKTKL